MAIVKVNGTVRDGRFTPANRRKRECIKEITKGRRSFNVRRKTSESGNHDYVRPLDREDVDFGVKIPKQCGSFDVCGQPGEFDDHYDNTVKRSILEARFQPQPAKVPRKIIASQKLSVRRNIRRALKAYQDILAKMDGRKRKAMSYYYIKVAEHLKKQGLWVNTKKHLGDTPGVKIGDKVRYRAQLYVIGLHQQYHNGIDRMWTNGKNLATSIVDSGRYANNMHNDMLIYSGQGGKSPFDNVKPTDQTLKGGNLALMKSKGEGNPVRVVRRLRLDDGWWYVYFGLYIIVKVKEERQLGYLVYKFYLRRIPGQPEVAFDRSQVKG